LTAETERWHVNSSWRLSLRFRGNYDRKLQRASRAVKLNLNLLLHLVAMGRWVLLSESRRTVEWMYLPHKIVQGTKWEKGHEGESMLSDSNKPLSSL
ncbi:mCG1037528, partial [Mus musculus]